MACVANVGNAVHDHVLISSYCKIKILFIMERIHIICDTVLFGLNSPITSIFRIAKILLIS